MYGVIHSARASESKKLETLRQDPATTSEPSAADEASPEKDDFELDILPRLIGYQLKRAHVKVVNSFADHLNGLGLTPGQFAVLVLIGANPGSSQSTLARVVGSSRSLMVRTVDRLERNGLVSRERAPGDRRSHAIILTPSGSEMVVRLKQDVASHERRVTSGLDDEDRDKLLQLLRQLNRDGPA